MASTYSNLKIQLMATGENSTTWGTVTNTNLGTALEEAIVGSADVTFSSGNVTLTLTDTNASQTARNMRLRLTGTTGGSTRNLVVPSIEKPYIVQNDCADSVVVKTAAGTGITVPAGKTMWVYSDGTNVVNVTTYITSLSLGTALAVADGGTGANTAAGARTALGAAASGANSDITSLSGLTTALSVAQGGTGVNTHTAGYLLKGNGTSAVSASVTYDDGTNFGIGTATPGAKLDVAGNILLSSATPTITLNSGGAYISNAGAANTFAVSTSTTERFRIGASGQWGLSGANYGTSGQVLTSQGSGAAPTWTTISPGTGTVTSVSGTGSANGLSLSGTVTTSGNITLSGSVTSVANNATVNGVAIGYRSIPRSTTSGTATTSDVGQCIAVTAGITIPNSTFAAGDAISIYNDSASSITITAGVTTLRQAGTTNTGNRTLAARGMATIWFNSSTEAIISGAGVS